MARLFGDREIPTSVLVGAPLLIAGSAASVALYRRGSDIRGARGPEARRRGQRLVRELMTQRPACCTADTALRQVAEMMVASDCGEIPVCDDARKPSARRSIIFAKGGTVRAR